MTYKIWILGLFLTCSLIACQEEFIPELEESEPRLVVEGYIEAGDQALPPYLILTKSTKFYSTFDLDLLSGLYVHDAEVFVDNGTDTVQLTEVCLSTLTPAQQELFGEFLGLGTDSIVVDFCLYTDLTFSMLGEEGKTYNLSIDADGEKVSATTTIPIHVPLDSVGYTDHPNFPENDTLAQMRCFLSDPPTVEYYRYMTSQNDGPMVPGLGSVVDDRVFNGQEFEFPISRGQSALEDIDPDTFGYFWKGDTATIKWITLDEAHYDFWSTAEFDTGSQGPFTSYVRIVSNIEGGLGIWGGLAASFHTIVIPE